MTENKTEHDLDLLAYVDRLLDEDPARKAQFEERMRASPELASRVRAYEAQGEALRRAYDARLYEPVPDRLLAVLETVEPLRGGILAKVAALLLLIASASIVGWLVGRSHQSADDAAYDLVERSYREFVSTGASPHLPAGEQSEPLRLAGDRVSLSLRVPDLSQLGYNIVDKQTIARGAQRMLRLTYAKADGESFSLFLDPRSDDNEREIALTTESSVSLAHWVEGPLAAALVSRLAPEETLSIARTIRDSLVDPNVSRPTMHSTSPRRQRELITGLPALDAPARPHVSAAPPRPTQSKSTNPDRKSVV